MRSLGGKIGFSELVGNNAELSSGRANVIIIQMNKAYNMALVEFLNANAKAMAKSANPTM